MTIEPSKKTNISLNYHFTPRELMVIARFLRKKQNELPEELSDFYATVEHTVYNVLSVDEAEQFYS
jgi:hypothetical protein